MAGYTLLTGRGARPSPRTPSLAGEGVPRCPGKPPGWPGTHSSLPGMPSQALTSHPSLSRETPGIAGNAPLAGRETLACPHKPQNTCPRKQDGPSLSREAPGTTGNAPPAEEEIPRCPSPSPRCTRTCRGARWTCPGCVAMSLACQGAIPRWGGGRPSPGWGSSLPSSNYRGSEHNYPGTRGSSPGC